MKETIAETIAGRPPVAGRLSPARPRASVTTVSRLTDAQGITFWGHLTLHSMTDVLSAGYFDPCHERRGGGLERHDRIVVTASAETNLPDHFTLIVVDTDTENGVRVGLLVEARAA